MQHRSDIEQFARVFIGRRDDYAIQREDGRYRRVGQPLTLDTVYRHLAGGVTIGTYCIDERGLCQFAVFDADSDTGLEQLAELQMRLADDGIASHLEQSRRGGHLWVLLAQPVRPDVLRAWLLAYCPPDVEFYPKQDAAAGYGSLIRVPLGVHRMSGTRYPFVLFNDQDEQVPLAHNLPNLLALVPCFERAVAPDVIISTTPTLTRSRSNPHTQSLTNSGYSTIAQSRYTSIAEWVEDQDAVRIISRYVTLDRRGLGCCPFGEHHSDGKDSHPSFRAYKPRARGASCWYCYTAQRGGNVFNFLCLYHGLDAQTMWWRIQSGDIW